MSAPRRWRETDGVPDGASNEGIRMLRAGRATRALPDDVHGRVSRRVAAAATVPIVASILLSWKGVAVASVVVLTAAAGYVAKHPTVVPWGTRLGAKSLTVDARPLPAPRAPSLNEPPAPELPAPALAASAGGDAPLADRDAPIDAPAAATKAPARRHARAHDAEDGPPEDTLAREVALLERARSLFDASPASALAVLDDHARAFPHGKLVIERELLALDVLERLGRHDEAVRRAQRLLARARGTIYESRVRDHLAKLNVP